MQQVSTVWAKCWDEGSIFVRTSDVCKCNTTANINNISSSSNNNRNKDNKEKTNGNRNGNGNGNAKNKEKMKKDNNKPKASVSSWCCGPAPHVALSYWAFSKLAHPLYGAMHAFIAPATTTTVSAASRLAPLAHCELLPPPVLDDCGRPAPTESENANADESTVWRALGVRFIGPLSAAASCHHHFFLRRFLLLGAAPPPDRSRRHDGPDAPRGLHFNIRSRTGERCAI